MKKGLKAFFTWVVLQDQVVGSIWCYANPNLNATGKQGSRDWHADLQWMLLCVCVMWLISMFVTATFKLNLN